MVRETSKRLTADEIREIVHDAVKSGIEDAFDKVGIDHEDKREMQADFAYLRNSRNGARALRQGAFRAAIGTAVPALLYALWYAIKGQ